MLQQYHMLTTNVDSSDGGKRSHIDYYHDTQISRNWIGFPNPEEVGRKNVLQVEEDNFPPLPISEPW